MSCANVVLPSAPSELSGHAIQHEEISIRADGRNRLASLSVDLRIENHRCFGNIGFPDVVMDDLVVPAKLPGLASRATRQSVYKLSPGRFSPPYCGTAFPVA